MSCRRLPPFRRFGASAPHGLEFRAVRLVVVLDAVMVVEIIDHDAEGVLDRTARGVAQPIDPFEPRAVAEVKARYWVDAASG